jgi:hypothetical protein
MNLQCSLRVLTDQLMFSRQFLRILILVCKSLYFRTTIFTYICFNTFTSLDVKNIYLTFPLCYKWNLETYS